MPLLKMLPSVALLFIVGMMMIPQKLQNQGLGFKRELLVQPLKIVKQILPRLTYSFVYPNSYMKRFSLLCLFTSQVNYTIDRPDNQTVN